MSFASKAVGRILERISPSNRSTPINNPNQSNRIYTGSAQTQSNFDQHDVVNIQSGPVTAPSGLAANVDRSRNTTDNQSSTNTFAASVEGAATEDTRYGARPKKRFEQRVTIAPTETVTVINEPLGAHGTVGNLHGNSFQRVVPNPVVTPPASTSVDSRGHNTTIAQPSTTTNKPVYTTAPVAPVHPTSSVGATHHQTRTTTRSSVEEFNDPSTISGKIGEVRSILRRIQLLKGKSSFYTEAPVLHRELVEKIEKITQYTVLGGTGSLYRPDLVDFAKQADEIRTLFTSEPEARSRFRSNSVDDNELRPESRKSPTVHYSSDFAETLRRQSLIEESSTHPLPQENPQDLPVFNSAESSPFHGFPAEMSKVTLDQLFDRIASVEAELEERVEEFRARSKDVNDKTGVLKTSTNCLQRQLTKCENDIASLESFNKTHMTALRNRLGNLESIPIANEMKVIRSELSKLRLENPSSQSIANNPALNSLIDRKMDALKQELLALVNPSATLPPHAATCSSQPLKKMVDDNTFNVAKNCELLQLNA